MNENAQEITQFALPPSPVVDNKQTTVAPQVGQVIDSPPPDDTGADAEETHIEEVKKNYRLTPKFNKWCELFFDKKNEKTYLNRTQSALIAYNLDPVTQYYIAGTIGSENYKKLENVASRIAEDKGYTFEKWLDVAWLNTLKKESPEWWDRFGDMVGFRSMKPAVVVQQNTQNNTVVNVGEEQKKSFNDQFRSFIKAS